MSSAAPSPPPGADPGGLTDAAPRLDVRYVHAPMAGVLADPCVLAAIGFGDAGFGGAVADEAAGSDPRCFRVALEPLEADAPLEVWTAAGPVATGRSGRVGHASDGRLQFLSLEVPERDDIRGAAREAYREIVPFAQASGYPHVLRLWNYLDAITAGEGDEERYRQFCIGRAEGIGQRWPAYPAATAIGTRTGRRVLQVYALASRDPGVALENPRQVSAYCYPRQYGPQPPSFARAMLPAQPGVPLLLSGTASVVGHASAHPDCALAQLEETCANLERLLATARERAPALPDRFGPCSTLKVYLREPERADDVRQRLLERFPGVGLLLLAADVCRRELRVEVDGFHA